MAHWVETYPHTVYASVLLKDNKITNWKIGERRWLHHMDMTRRVKHPFSLDDYADETVESKAWEVNNSEEHSRVFEVLAKEWFKQWKIHEDYEGSPAYKEPVNYWDKARVLLPKSNCLKRQYACVIVMNGHIISSGYNKSLTGCTTCAREDIAHNVGDYAECRSIHAEQMSMIKARENSLEGAELYLVCAEDADPTPCGNCQRMLDWAGVKQVKEVVE